MSIFIVSVTKIVPYASAPHAGGQYYYQHLKTLLSLGYKVTVVAPKDPRNIEAAQHLDLPVDLILFGKPAKERHGRFPNLLFSNLRDKLYKGRLSQPFRSAFRRDLRVHRALFSADLIEFQWTEAGELATSRFPRLEKQWPSTAPRVLVAHDVLKQREDRRVDSRNGASVKRILARLRRRYTVRDESRTVMNMNLVLTLSSKDRDLIQEMHSGARIVSISPPLGDANPTEKIPRGSSQNVLFVGAFHRPENIDAALWLLRDIWPRVISQNDKAKLIIAGAAPTSEMQGEAREAEGVTVTGYVDSLQPFYEACLVNVVPLRQGAGVKFKTIDAMLMGQAVVSTSVGLEGIDAPAGVVWSRVDKADEVANAILSAIAEPELAASVGHEASLWASKEFSQDNYASCVREEYSRVLGARGCVE